VGIGTSSGTVGHSLSLDSADATARALGNVVKAADDTPQAIEKAQSIEGLYGVVIIVGGKMGVWAG
jgi:ApbE superfamily uncharacterized protein (UPF0280 family)